LIKAKIIRVRLFLVKFTQKVIMNKIEDLQQYLETQKSIPENNMAEATMKVVEMLKKVETEFKKVNPEAKIVY
jgi:hypothetical protein